MYISTKTSISLRFLDYNCYKYGEYEICRHVYLYMVTNDSEKYSASIFRSNYQTTLSFPWVVTKMIVTPEYESLSPTLKVQPADSTETLVPI
jgi:hypothetical protein